MTGLKPGHYKRQRRLPHGCERRRWREAQGIVGMPLKLGYCTTRVNGVVAVVLPEVAVTVIV